MKFQVRRRRQDDPMLGFLLEVELNEDLDEGCCFDGLFDVDVVAAGGARDLAAAAEMWILWRQRRNVGGGGTMKWRWHDEVEEHDVVEYLGIVVGHCGGVWCHGWVKVPLWKGIASRATVTPICVGTSKRSCTSGPGHRCRHFRFPGWYK
jgi:hypothetical protein